VIDNQAPLEVSARHLGVTPSRIDAEIAAFAYDTSVADVIADAAASFALKQRIHFDAARDPIDALNDAVELLRISQLRVDALMAAHREAEKGALVFPEPNRMRPK